uniref:Uncharacterized protein n=1 Tax=Anguilla anguilla TaxID=7936 RepID=A0A0E9Q5D9_ANGAN
MGAAESRRNCRQGGVDRCPARTFISFGGERKRGS